MARLRELVGEVEEEEPEGEAVVQPSGEPQHIVQVVHPFFHSEFCTEIYFKKILFFFNLSFPSLPLSYLTDKSSEEGASRLLTKEEEDIDTLQSWVQVGGFPAQPKEEAWGLLVEVGSLHPLLPLFL